MPRPEHCEWTRLYEEFVRVFLHGSNLEHFLIYTCNASKSDDSDPITNTVVLVLSMPVSISLSNVGVRAFKSTSIATLPYNVLDRDQCNVVYKLLAAMKKQQQCHIMSDATGGFVVRFPQPRVHVFVDKSDTMLALSNAIQSTAAYKDPDVKSKVFNILSQRISAMTTLPQQAKQ